MVYFSNLDIKNLDESRRLDYFKMQAKINDPKTSEAERRMAEDALYVIKEQSRNPHITQLRSKMEQAVRSGDTELAEKVSTQAKDIDRHYKR